jgi:hypothetical protein
MKSFIITAAALSSIALASPLGNVLTDETVELPLHMLYPPQKNTQMYNIQIKK